MAVTYRPAPAAQRIGDKLVANVHTALVDVEIRYIFRSETAKSNGKEVWAKARKIGGLNAFLAGEQTEAGGGAQGAFDLGGDE